MKVLVAGGGTGGHLFPGLAVAEAIARLRPGAEIVFLGTERGIEAHAVPAAGHRLLCIDVRPLKRMGLAGTLRGIAALPAAVAQAFSIVRAERPDVVIGVGGYASGPAVAAAALRGIPTVLLEQNAVPGLTNRVCAKLVRRSYATFPESVAALGGEARVVVAGNPVRRGFAGQGSDAPADGAIFIFGGSQGARALNRTVPDALALLRPDRRVLHQTGPAALDEVRGRYGALGIEADVRAFVDDMPGALQDAALVVCRAGSGSLAELTAVGRPSILVPLPTAADDHQTANAASLEAAGAAVLVPERDLTPSRMAEVIRALLDDEPRRRRMASAALDRGRPDAAMDIARDVLTLLATRETGNRQQATGNGQPQRDHPEAPAPLRDFRFPVACCLLPVSGSALLIPSDAEALDVPR